jgi:Ca-activated chloride channel family protein
MTRMRPLVLLLSAAVLAAATASPLAASARSKNEEGNRLYKQKKYDEALKRYTEAQLEAPDAPQLHYNLGNVFFKKGDVEKARDEYRRALASAEPGLDPLSVYNMGNTFFSQQQYKDAVSSYQRALKLNPTDADAKRNLELALLKMKQQQQKQQQQGDKKKEDQQQKQQPSGQQQAPSQGQEKRQNSGEKKQEEKQQPSSSPQQKGGLSRDEAERILNALQEDEKDNLKKRMEKAKEDQQQVEKDW